MILCRLTGRGRLEISVLRGPSELTIKRKRHGREIYIASFDVFEEVDEIRQVSKFSFTI